MSTGLTAPSTPSCDADPHAERARPDPLAEFGPVPEHRPPAVVRQRVLPRPPPNQPTLIPLLLDDAPEIDVVDERITRFAVGLARAALEVLQGRRPATQLTRWLSDTAQAELLHRVRLHQRDRPSATGPTSTGPFGAGQVTAGQVTAGPVTAGPVTVRSVRVQQPHPAAAEVTFRIGNVGHDAALAVRLDRLGGRWVCSVLDFGPGPPRR